MDSLVQEAREAAAASTDKDVGDKLVSDMLAMRFAAGR